MVNTPSRLFSAISLILLLLLASCSGDNKSPDTESKKSSVEVTSAKPVSEYDVVINNGRVMDPETKFDGIRNVGIKDGKIVTITEKTITGRDTIDATGHVVAPGFIDTEQHGLSPWGIKVNLLDGVTTQMDFEVGAANIGEWYAAKKGKVQANYGTVVGQEFARMCIHDGLKLEGSNVSMPNLFKYRAEAAKDGVDGWSVSRSNVEQMNEITKILDEGLRLGAIGVGSTIGYAQKGITTYEMFEAQRAAARYSRLTAAHHRFHPSAGSRAGSQCLGYLLSMDCRLWQLWRFNCFTSHMAGCNGL